MVSSHHSRCGRSLSDGFAGTPSGWYGFATSGIRVPDYGLAARFVELTDFCCLHPPQVQTGAASLKLNHFERMDMRCNAHHLLVTTVHPVVARGQGMPL